MDRFVAPRYDADMAYARIFEPDITPPGRIIPRTATACSDASFVLTPPPSPKKKPERPSRSLDLPDLSDDFYKNVLAWPEPSKLLVGLDQYVHAYDPVAHKVVDTIDVGETVTGVAYHSGTLAVSTARGNVALIKEAQVLRRVVDPGHRTLALTFRQEQEWTCGTRQGYLQHHDERVQAAPVSFRAHHLEVLRILWSPFSANHVATGGNDDQVFVYDLRNTSSPYFAYHGHRAAVKALCWSPFISGVLVSGGGTGDQTIATHRTTTGTTETPVTTSGQVTSVHVVNRGNLLSTHGFVPDGPDAPRMYWHGGPGGPVFPCMSSRILDSVLSPNRTELVTTNSLQRLEFYDLSAYIRKPSSARQLGYVLR